MFLPLETFVVNSCILIFPRKRLFKQEENDTVEFNVFSFDDSAEWSGHRKIGLVVVN